MIIPATLFLSFAALIAFFFPFHLVWFSVATFGAAHVHAEWNYFIAQRGILRDRRKYPPFLLSGALAFMLLSLPFVIATFPERADGFLFFRLFYVMLWIYVLAALIYAGTLRLHHWVVAAVTIAGAIWLSIENFLFLIFIKIHFHNLQPFWFWYIRTRNLRVVFLFLLWGVAIPAIIFSLFYFDLLHISTLSAGFGVERAWFEHVLPDFWPLQNPLLLLSLFAYLQILHYYLWIFRVADGGAGALRTLPDYFGELLFSLGLRKRRRVQSYSVRIVLWGLIGVLAAASFAAFFVFPLGYKKLYFALALTHTFLELPLLFLESVREKAENKTV